MFSRLHRATKFQKINKSESIKNVIDYQKIDYKNKIKKLSNPTSFNNYPYDTLRAYTQIKN